MATKPVTSRKEEQKVPHKPSSNSLGSSIKTSAMRSLKTGNQNPDLRKLNHQNVELLNTPPPPPPSPAPSVTKSALTIEAVASLKFPKDESSSNLSFEDRVRDSSSQQKSAYTPSEVGSTTSSVWKELKKGFEELLEGSLYKEKVLQELPKVLGDVESGNDLPIRSASPFVPSLDASPSIVKPVAVLHKPLDHKITAYHINGNRDQLHEPYSTESGELLLVTLPSEKEIGEMKEQESIELSLTCCAVTDGQMEALIKKLPHLQKISLICCPKLTDLCLKSFESCQDLISLEITGSKNITKEAISGLKRLLANLTTTCDTEEENETPVYEQPVQGFIDSAVAEVVIHPALERSFSQAVWQEAQFRLEQAKGSIFKPHFQPQSSSRVPKNKQPLSRLEAEKYIASFDPSSLKMILESYQKALSEYGVEVDSKSWLELEVLYASAKDLWQVVLSIIQTLEKQTCYQSRRPARNYEDLIDDLKEDGVIEEIKDLDLRNKKITFIPKLFSEGLFTSLQRVNLSSNEIREVLPEAFGVNNSLTILSLAHNQIDQFPCLNLPHLEYLNLSYNRIQQVSENGFQSWKELQGIRLDHNSLSLPVLKIVYGKIADHLSAHRKEYSKEPALRCQPPLTQYVTQEARFLRAEMQAQKIPFFRYKPAWTEEDYTSILAGYHILLPPEIQNLEEMDLLWQIVSNIEKVFPILLKILPKMEISYTHPLSPTAYAELLEYTKMEPEAFKQIKSLNLQGLGLTFVPSFLLKMFPNIESLDLENNQIRMITSVECEKWLRLRSLNLNNNQIFKLPKEGFRFLSHLEALLISNNQMKCLPTDIGVFLPSLKVLDLTHNSPMIEELKFLRSEEIEKWFADLLESFQALELFQVSLEKFSSEIKKGVEKAIENRLKEIKRLAPPRKDLKPIGKNP